MRLNPHRQRLYTATSCAYPVGLVPDIASEPLKGLATLLGLL